MLGSRASTQGKKTCNSTVNGRCTLLERSPHRDKIILGMFPRGNEKHADLQSGGKWRNFPQYWNTLNDCIVFHYHFPFDFPPMVHLGTVDTLGAKIKKNVCFIYFLLWIILRDIVAEVRLLVTQESEHFYEILFFKRRAFSPSHWQCGIVLGVMESWHLVLSFCIFWANGITVKTVESFDLYSHA